MSLLDPIAACEAVLQTVMTQEIVLSNRSDCLPEQLIGAGTVTDPYNALGKPLLDTDASSDLPFDAAMRIVLASGVPKTVKLLPGTYYTRGFPSPTSGLGWRPGSGLRLIGSGTRNTILKRTGTPASVQNAIIGNDFTSQSVDGLEVSDLSLDAGYVYASSGGSAMSGIAVYGRNILVKRVRVTNIGNNSGNSQPSFGISVARVPSSPAFAPVNCVVAECVVDTPGSGALGPLYGIHLSSESDGHLHWFCTVRNCFVDLQDPANSYVGIAVGGGIGTIVEHNRFINCQKGVILPNVLSTRDLTVRHNYFRLAHTGIDLNMTGAGMAVTLGRLLLLNNLVEWPGSGYASAVLGILVQGGGGTKFDRVLIRDNVVRRYDNSTNTGDLGIKIDSAAETLVDNNILDVGTINNGVQMASTGVTIKPFNNLKSDGTLLQAFTTDSAIKVPELSTLLQDVDIALFKR